MNAHEYGLGLAIVGRHNGRRGLFNESVNDLCGLRLDRTNWAYCCAELHIHAPLTNKYRIWTFVTAGFASPCAGLCLVLRIVLVNR
jgi:hypothetical protein